MTDEKQLYIAVYDYGMGGVWVAFKARAPKDIEEKYPEFEVMSTRPEWMDDEMFEGIIAAGVSDIDEPPTGALAEHVRLRTEKRGGRP